MYANPPRGSHPMDLQYSYYDSQVWSPPYYQLVHPTSSGESTHSLGFLSPYPCDPPAPFHHPSQHVQPYPYPYHDDLEVVYPTTNVRLSKIQSPSPPKSLRFNNSGPIALPFPIAIPAAPPTRTCRIEQHAPANIPTTPVINSELPPSVAHRSIAIPIKSNSPLTTEPLPEPSPNSPFPIPHRPKRFTCTSCDKRFDRPSTLKKHMLVHTGEKPYECENCHRRFGVRSNLNRHTLKCMSKLPSACFYSTEQVDDDHPTDSISYSSSSSCFTTGPPTKPRRRGIAAKQEVWIPPSLRAFHLITGNELYGTSPSPLPPAIIGTVSQDGLVEERNSWDENVPPCPYHPTTWNNKLPGPAVHKNDGPGANANGQIFKWNIKDTGFGGGSSRSCVAQIPTVMKAIG